MHAMIVPVEMQQSLPRTLHNGVPSTTTEIWDILVASREGNLDRVKALGAAKPALLTCQYDYTPPLHFAVREGHLELVRFLLDRGALDATYTNHPFKDTLPTMARDREYGAIAQLLEEYLQRPDVAAHGDMPETGFGSEFERLVDKDDLAAVERMLQERPGLATDPLTFWGEGVLAIPAKGAQHAMIELLMRFGARVPDVAKWARNYYFRHDETAALLLERGMNPNHMTWRRITLLHDMAVLGRVSKARLLLDHGAAVDPIDEEYRSTPLGLAARFGQPEMVDLLLARGADVNKAGASWATPLAWARKKAHADIEATLRHAGAR